MSRVKTYWFKSEKNGFVEEKAFDIYHASEIGCVFSDKTGVDIMSAHRILERWNRMGNRNGYFYSLTKPEAV